jgi:ABC-2 family transporter protein
VLWLTVRQFRAQALVAAAGVVVLGVVVALVGAHVLHDWSSVSGCATSADCSVASNAFESKYQEIDQWLDVLVLVLPGLIGVFWGAPLVARELETGTFRLAFSQSVSRRRWILTKLAVLGLSGIAVAGLCSLLVTWWAAPLDRVGSGPFSTFDSRGIVPLAYAALAFTLGVAIGAVTRRTVPAMVATLVSFVGLRVFLAELVRPHLMAALVDRAPFQFLQPRRVTIGNHLPRGSWVLSESIVNKGGHAISGGQLGLLTGQSVSVGPAGVSIAGAGSCPDLTPSGRPGTTTNLVQQCVNQLHLTDVIRYQPPSRYWPFQIEESLLCLALALLLAGLSLWWVRRRIS